VIPSRPSSPSLPLPRLRPRPAGLRAAARLATTGLLVVLALGGTAPAAAQETAATSGTFLDRVEVNVVNVEVFVTDRDGRRVPGLTRDDFVLRVDGEPVELSNFFVAGEPSGGANGGSNARPATASATAAPAAAPAALDQSLPAATPTHRPLYLTVFVDHTQIKPANRKRVLNDLRRLVEQRAAAGDEIMLAEYGGSLSVVTPFSRDPAALDAGLDHLQKASALGGATLTGSVASSQTVRDLSVDASRESDPNTSAALLHAADAIASSRVQYLYEQGRRSFLALDSMVLSLAGLPGRKALLWVTDGVPRRPGIEFTAMQEGVDGAAIQGQRYDLGRVYRQVIEQANANEVTFYTLDARGPNPNVSQSAEFKDVAGVAVLAEDVPRLETPDFEATRNASLQEPLLDLANATGGHAVLNTFEFASAFERLVEDFDTYYSLGFVSPAAGDGGYHRIDVKVKRPGLHVRHREGFLDKAAADRVEDRVRSFLVQGWESNPMGVALQFGEPKRKHRMWRVPVLVRIPSQAVTLLPQDGEQVGKLQIFVGVRDEDGRESRVSRLAQEIAVPAGDSGQSSGGQGGSDQGDLGYRVELEMRPGPASLVVGVWDEVGGGESYVFQRVVVGGQS